jgi:hypothetical protein
MSPPRGLQMRIADCRTSQSLGLTGLHYTLRGDPQHAAHVTANTVKWILLGGPLRFSCEDKQSQSKALRFNFLPPALGVVAPADVHSKTSFGKMQERRFQHKERGDQAEPESGQWRLDLGSFATKLMHANDLVPLSSLDQTDSTEYAAKRRIVPPVAFDACYAYRLRNANLTQATKIARALGSVGEPEQADERAARLVGVLQRTGIEVNSTNLEHVARLIDLTRFLKSKEISRPSLQTVRELAVAHAVWRGKQTQTTPAEPVGRAGWFDAPWFSDLFGRVDDGTRFVSPNPLGQNPERSPAQSPTAWSNELIRDGVTALAQRYGITSPVQIALMIDVLQNPSLTAGQRGVASGRSESGVIAPAR